MSKIQLNISVQEVNLVIKSLSYLPYNQVCGLIEEIHKQALEQVKEGEVELNVNGENQKTQ